MKICLLELKLLPFKHRQDKTIQIAKNEYKVFPTFFLATDQLG